MAGKRGSAGGGGGYVKRESKKKMNRNKARNGVIKAHITQTRTFFRDFCG